MQQDGTQHRLHFTQQKTKGVEYMSISEQAYKLCGERLEPERLVFESLPDPSWISRPLERWIKSAGITRKITFHCLRYSDLYFSLKTSGLQDLNLQKTTFRKRAKFYILPCFALIKKTHISDTEI